MMYRYPKQPVYDSLQHWEMSLIETPKVINDEIKIVHITNYKR